MRRTPRSLFVIQLALVVGMGTSLFAATNTTAGVCFVNHGGNGYSTIQAAVNGASPGGIVYVCPGTYHEQVTVAQPVTIQGVQVTAGTLDQAVVLPPSGGLVSNGTDIFGNPIAAQIFVNNAGGNVTIKGITVDGTGNDLVGCGAPTLEGIYYQATSGTITDTIVRNQYQTDYTDYGGCQNGLAINVESLTSAFTVTVSNNYVSAYQKNGITATGAATGSSPAGPAVTISGNYVVGLAATGLNWPKSGAAENGIQFGFGATGKVTGNTVTDNIWGQDVFGDTGDAASGILVYASNGVMLTNNIVTSAQYGVAAVTDTSANNYGSANSTVITGNKVAGTQLYDAIDACSQTNNVLNNTLFGSSESGVHLDDSCGAPSEGNTVEHNTINGGCAGILTGNSPANTNTIGSNTFYSVGNVTMAGDVCQGQAPPAPGAAEKTKLNHAPRVSPFISRGK